MHITSITTALILALGATTAFAAEPAPAGPSSAQMASNAESDPNRKICKRERPMGSLIPKNICKTAAQWDKEREDSRKMMQDMQQRTGSTSSR